MRFHPTGGLRTLQVDPDVGRTVEGAILVSAVILSGYASRSGGRT
jgi:hypothetical protein